MEVQLLKEKSRKGIMIIPETDFELEYLSHCFIGETERHVIVKSGSSISDLQSVNVYAEVKDVKN